MDNYWQDFREWLASPFKADMSAFHWFLLIGFVLACIVIWNIVLSHLANAIRGAT